MRQRKSVKDRAGYLTDAGRRYADGQSIREISAALGGSYGWAYNLVRDAIAAGLRDADGNAVTMRDRGGDQRSPQKTAAKTG